MSDSTQRPPGRPEPNAPAHPYAGAVDSGAVAPPPQVAATLAAEWESALRRFLVAALRLLRPDGVRAIDDAVTRIAESLRRLPLIGNPLTELGLGVVSGLSHGVVETADHAARRADGIGRVVGDLDVSEMERQSRSAWALASNLRRRVERREGEGPGVGG